MRNHWACDTTRRRSGTTYMSPGQLAALPTEIMPLPSPPHSQHSALYLSRALQQTPFASHLQTHLPSLFHNRFNSQCPRQPSLPPTLRL